MRKSLLLLGLLISLSAFSATTPQDLLKQYAVQAKQENPKFSGFSAERGEVFYQLERQHSRGQKVSCASCHTADPKKQGKTRANKVIEPMASVVNPQRFTDASKVEKWFGRNCIDVLERACNAQEKGDYMHYLVNLK